MIIEKVNGIYAICKLKNNIELKITDGLFFYAKTEDEISLVCDIINIPSDAICVEKSYKAFRVAGSLDFDLTGIISKISDVLANNGIPIFVVSTFDTDYVLVKEEYYMQSYELLKNI